MGKSKLPQTSHFNLYTFDLYYYNNEVSVYSVYNKLFFLRTLSDNKVYLILSFTDVLIIMENVAGWIGWQTREKKVCGLILTSN